MKLTCVEAIGATLYIVGLKEEAINLLTVFDWGKEFLKINHDILERYSMTTNSNEIVKAQNEWLIENGVDLSNNNSNNNNNNHGDVNDDSKTNETNDGNVKEESNTNMVNDMNRDEDNNNNNKTTITNKTKKTIVNVELLPLISNNQIINNNNNDKTNIDTSTTTSNDDVNDNQTPSSLLDMASLKLKNDNVVEIDNKDTSSVSSTTTTTTNKDNEGHINNNNNNNNQLLIIPTIKEIKKMKPPQLRKFLKSRNINTQGNKKELIKRCLEIIKDI